MAPAGTIGFSSAAATAAKPSQQATSMSTTRDEKGVRHLLPERPGGCFAQKAPDPFFTAESTELEWCDRRLLARIHRLTINRLRAEIQPVSPAEFQRFLLAWQHVDADHRVEGPDGVESVLELLDGYELPAAAWEPEILASRVNQYTPHWLDQLCFTGRIGWGRLTPPQNRRAGAFGCVSAAFGAGVSSTCGPPLRIIACLYGDQHAGGFQTPRRFANSERFRTL